MKKALLALAVTSTFAGAAMAQTNVTIYGIVDAGVSSTNNGSNRTTALTSGQQSGSRLGFKGSEDLGGGLSAIFTLENGFNVDQGTLGQNGALFGRQAFVGLNGGFGAVKLGRQYTPMRTALESIDPFAIGLAGNILNVFYGNASVDRERANNTINYSTPNFNGFSGQVAYSFGEVAGSTSTGRQIGLSAGYANGPINVILAHNDQNLVDATGIVDSGKAKTTMLGGTYDFGVVKAHAAYATNKSDNAGVQLIDSRDLMVGLSAPIGAGTVLASYMRKDDKLTSNGDTNVLSVGYTYDLSKRTDIYTSYARINNQAGASVGFYSGLNLGATASNPAAAGLDPSTFNVGIRHKF